MNKTYLLIGALLITPPAWADDVHNMTARLVGMRAELDSESRAAENELKEKQAELDLWLQKKMELESSVQKETLRGLQLQQKTVLLSQKVKRESSENPKERVELKAALQKVMKYVEVSLPYRQSERMSSLKRIEERLESGLESSETLAADLWMFLESEIKMAGDNEFRITEIATPRGVESAEVVRLGNFTMFALTPTHQVYRAEHLESGWSMQEVTAKSDQDEIRRLIGNVKSKKKSGLYALPLPKETL
ncbi:MAG: DUF3450 family protein [Bdellovibrionales bacterium]